MSFGFKFSWTLLIPTSSYSSGVMYWNTKYCSIEMPSSSSPPSQIVSGSIASTLSSPKYSKQAFTFVTSYVAVPTS